MTKLIRILYLVPLITTLIATNGIAQTVVNSTFFVNEGTTISSNSGIAFSSTSNAAFNTGSTLNINTSSDARIVNLTGQTMLIPNFTLDGSGIKTFSGVMAISENLNINQGALISDQNSVVIGKDANLQVSNGAYIQGFLVHQGLGTKQYPMGYEGTLGTAQLVITEGDDDTALTGIAFLPQSAQFALPSVDGVNAVSNSWVWVLGGADPKVSEVTLLIPAEDELIVSSLDSKGVIVQSEVDGSGGLSLGGVQNGNSITSQQSAIGPVLRLGGEQIVELVIHNIITPNGDGQNDILTIENIEQINGVKRVTFLDRWGTQTGNNIVDFQNDDPSLVTFFESFQSGNYICILELEDGRKIQQPITILKN